MISLVSVFLFSKGSFVTNGAKQYGSIRTAAQITEVSEKTIRRWIADGLIRAERIGPRLIRVDLESLHDLGRPLNHTESGA